MIQLAAGSEDKNCLITQGATDTMTLDQVAKKDATCVLDQPRHGHCELFVP